jgi:hypothetical protein
MKKSRRTTPKKTLTKKQIKAALIEMGRTPRLSLPQRIVADWTAWRNAAEWLKQNPKSATQTAVVETGGRKKTVLEEHTEKFGELKSEISHAVVIALIQDDADFFKDIAAAISKRKRIASKLNDGQKPFDLKKWLLLKEAYYANENVYQLGKFLKESGNVSKSTPLESVWADLFRRRKKLNLPRISSKG